jgi:hypothetical protein
MLALSLRLPIAAVIVLSIALVGAESLALESDCPPGADVCAKSLDPSLSASSDISNFLDETISWLSNNWLTILIIACCLFVALISRVLFLRKRRATSRFRRDGTSFRSAQEHRALALLQKINTETDDLQLAVDRIKEIMDDYVGRISDDMLFQDRGSSEAANSVSTRKQFDAQVVLSRIVRELTRVSDRLSDVRRDVRRTQGLSSAAADHKGESEAPNSGVRKLELIVQQRDSEIEKRNRELQQVIQQVARLSSEVEESKKQRREAQDLFDCYANGLPKFVTGREEGAHSDSFLQFLSNANSIASSHVSRLGMMLRVIADAMTRDDNSFELIWSVHEAGKALYTLMEFLGHNEVWQYEEAFAWARALNRYGEGRFTVFIPVVRSTFSGLEMTGGTPQSPIQEVKSWGVKNRRGDVERKAIVR